MGQPTSHAVTMAAAATATVVATMALAASVNDPLFSSQPNLSRIGCPAAWNESFGQNDVLVAIVDTGVNYMHLDVPANYRGDIDHDFINNDADAMDDNGHGTHGAGTIAEATNNGIGGAGVAPDVSVVGVKVLSATGSGSLQQVTDGINWAVSNGADIIYVGVMLATTGPQLEAAINNAENAGCLVVAPAGNGGGTTIAFPARYPTCVAVGAVDANDARASFSNVGPELDLVAPGVGVLSMTLTGYGPLSGTEVAAAHVAGAAALAWSVAPTGTTPSQIRQILQQTAENLGPPGPDVEYGHGLVRADAAVALASPPAASALSELWLALLALALGSIAAVRLQRQRIARARHG